MLIHCNACKILLCEHLLLSTPEASDLKIDACKYNKRLLAMLIRFYKHVSAIIIRNNLWSEDDVATDTIINDFMHV